MEQARTAHPSHQPRFDRIPPEAMEVISDVLLASSDRDAERPSYDEKQLDRKRRRAARAEEYFTVLTVARYTSQSAEVIRLSDQIGLTADERTAWQLFSQGYRPSEISRRMGITRPTAVRLLRTAARRISVWEKTFGGIGEVYHCEVRRNVYHKPTHCAQQPCRKLGYCKFTQRGE